MSNKHTFNLSSESSKAKIIDVSSDVVATFLLLMDLTIN